MLLETRLPYLSPDQRREVLRTTGLGAGHPLLDGPEHWGRLDLWAAADGYGSFDRDVVVSLDGEDTWRNDIGGRAGLVKTGAGTLTLTGANSYRGGTTLKAGTLAAGSPCAFGSGPLAVAGGTLRAGAGLHVRGSYQHSAGTLAVRAGARVEVSGDLTIGRDTTLTVEGRSGRAVIAARRVTGRFARVVVTPGHRADVTYTRSTVVVSLRRA